MKVAPNQLRITACRFLFLFLTIQLIPLTIYGAIEERGNSPVALGSGCTLAADPWNPSGRTYNPAAAAWANRMAFIIGYARPFGLSELDRLRLDLVYPLGKSVLGFGASNFGSDLYSERTYSVSVSNRLTSWLAFGAAAGRAEVSIQRYGSDSAWLGDAGLLLNYRMIRFGFGATNLISQGMESYGDNPVPTQGVFSLSIAPDPKLTFMLESMVMKGRIPEFHFGAEFQLYPNLNIRSGFDTSTERMHLGLGILFQGLNVDGSYDHHPWLGWTRAFGVGWGVESQ